MPLSVESNSEMTQTTESPKAVRFRSRVVLVMAVVILGFSMYGFIGKLIEFFHVLGGTGDTLFVITPVLNYLLATVGFILLLFWAIGQGMFHQVEQPKHRLLDDEEYLDRAERMNDGYQPESWIANR